MPGVRICVTTWLKKRKKYKSMAYVTPELVLLNKVFDTNVLHGTSRLCTGMIYIYNKSITWEAYLLFIFIYILHWLVSIDIYCLMVPVSFSALLIIQGRNNWLFFCVPCMYWWLIHSCTMLVRTLSVAQFSHAGRPCQLNTNQLQSILKPISHTAMLHTLMKMDLMHVAGQDVHFLVWPCLSSVCCC